MTLSSDLQKLYVDGLITLFELDARALGAGILRFHGHQQAENIIWQGETFEPMALEVSGLEMRSDGKASAPTLSMSNNIGGLQGAVSAYCLQFGDFAGAKLKVITTLAKYLDDQPTASNEAKEQLWYIEQKTSENANAVTFELSNPIDFEGLKIPVRQISSYCAWEYRSEQCGYTGAAMFTDRDEPTDNPALDKCSKRTNGCECRFGKGNVLRIGAFPASSLF